MTNKERYPTNAAKLNTSDFLAQEDLAGKEVTLTLKAAAEGAGPISLESVPRPPAFRVKEDKYVLHFEKTHKMLVLNATNRKLLQREWGNDTPSWVGRKVTLYRDPSVKFAGKAVGGIRIKLNNTPKQEKPNVEDSQIGSREREETESGGDNTGR